MAAAAKTIQVLLLSHMPEREYAPEHHGARWAPHIDRHAHCHWLLPERPSAELRPGRPRHRRMPAAAPPQCTPPPAISTSMSCKL